MTEYFQRDNINSDYSETLLIKVDSNFVTLYGTVQTWGIKYKYIINDTNDTIRLEKGMKIYNNSDSSFFFEYPYNDKVEKVEFKAISGINKIVNSDGLNSDKLGQFLNELTLVGKYHYKDKLIEFKQNETVENFDKFPKYKIRPRLGTNWSYDNRIIETDNGIWKYEKSNGNLILTKYTDKRDEYESYIISDEKITLRK